MTFGQGFAHTGHRSCQSWWERYHLTVFSMPCSKGVAGCQWSFLLEFGGVYGVAEVVAGAVLHVGDESFAGAGGIAEEAVHGGGEDACELDV